MVNVTAGHTRNGLVITFTYQPSTLHKTIPTNQPPLLEGYLVYHLHFGRC